MYVRESLIGGTMVDLWANENLVAKWDVGTTTKGGWAEMMSGALLLTNQRLIFDPTQIGGRHFVMQTINMVFSLQEHYMALTDITQVSSLHGGRPILRVDAINGDPRYYLVKGTSRGLIWDRRNIVVRDDAVERIGNAVRMIH